MLALTLLLASVAQSELEFWEDNIPMMSNRYEQSDREIVRADAKLFGVTAEFAQQMAQIAEKHRETMKDEAKTWNRKHITERWLEECNWRIECWTKLAHALGAKRNVFIEDQQTEVSFCRFAALYELRDLIGRDNFYAGSMPSPIPNYKFNPNR